MKKFTLLLIGASAFLGSHAQQLKQNKLIAVSPSNRITQDNPKAGTIALNKKTRGLPTPPPLPSTVGTKAFGGGTTYDLQTNNGMARRIITSGNTISGAWTISTSTPVTETSTFPDRGTGYTFYNGTTWSAAPTERLETVRTGFGSLAKDGNGQEVYVVHDGTVPTKLYANRKSGSTWTTTQLTTTSTAQAIWPHMAAAGNWMYIIAASSDTSSTNTTNKSNGIISGYFFSRSNDNGVTWIDNMIPMPLVDSSNQFRGSANACAISANGSNISVVVGDFGADLTLLTSSDNGATWTKKVILDWPFDHYNTGAGAVTDFNNDGIVDTIITSDGSFSVALDANNVTHVAAALVTGTNSTAGAGLSFFPHRDGMVGYYNSIADSFVVIDNILQFDHDCNGDSSISIGANYSSSTTANPKKDALYGSLGLLTQPSISIVAGTPQKVIIAYTAVMDADTTIIDQGIANQQYWVGSSDLDGQNYRDILVAISPDNGTTWGAHSVNVSRTAHYEEAFVSTPEIITGANLNLIYQGDIEPGTMLHNKDLEDPTFENSIIVQTVSIADLISMSALFDAPCGQSDLPVGVKNVVNGVFGIVNVFPNPSSDIANLSMKFINPATTVKIDMVDIAGNAVYHSELKNVLENTLKIPVAKLATGVYSIKVTTADGTITRKFVKD